MKRTYFRLLGASVGLAAFLCGPFPALAQTAPPMGPRLPQFAVLGGAAVTGSTGSGTLVNGDVGSSPTSTISNFPPSRTVSPYIVHYAIDAVVDQAHLDAIAAYSDMVSQGTGTPLGAQLNGQNLGPGLYSFTSTADLANNGTLTLNDPSSGKTGIFVFSVTDALTANVGSRVVGTANPCNVYWRIGSSATLNGNNFFGTVIADQSVTVSSANNLIGRAVGINAAVTMPAAGGNTIGGCSSVSGCPPVTLNPATLPAGTVGIDYSQPIIGDGETTLSGFSVATGALPPGLTLTAGGTITGTPTTSGIFNFTIQAADGGVCPGNRAYSIVIAGAAGGAAVGGPTLDSLGLSILILLLAAAGVFLVNRFTV